MSNKYCQALVELRNKPAHELKEVGDQWRTPDNIFWGITVAFEEKYGSQLELMFRFIDRALAIGVLA